jgi:uncharacterized membrane protein YfcA
MRQNAKGSYPKMIGNVASWLPLAVTEFGAIGILAAILVTFAAALIKGLVGFGMPLIMVVGLASFLPVEIAIAAMIIPTFLANIQQSLRDGFRAAIQAIVKFKLFIGVVAVTNLAATQLVPVLDPSALILALGIVITLLTVVQLAGYRLRYSPEKRVPVEISLGVVTGFFGGLAGGWGPTTVLFFLTLNMEKRAQIRAQGLVYLVGSFFLIVGHGSNGVMTTSTTVFSLLLVAPAMIGLFLGYKLHLRMNPSSFTTATRLVLLLAALNLIRRGLSD